MTTVRRNWNLLTALFILVFCVSAHAQLEISASVPKSKYKVGEKVQVLVLLKNVSSKTIHIDRNISGASCPDVVLGVEVVKPKVNNVIKGGCIGGGNFFFTPEVQQNMDRFVAGANSWFIALDPGYVYGTTVSVDADMVPQYPASLRITASYGVGGFVHQCRPQLEAAGFNVAYDAFRSKPIEVQIVER